jgi:heme exporter protein C
LKLLSKKLTFLTVISAASMMAAILLIFVYAPEEKTMGIIQKIFYFHVPLAWISFMAFGVTFVCSILYLAKGSIIWDTIALSSAQVGIIFNTLMLISGVLWAKPVWGVWWTWDPRLTTSLILWFIYAAYLLVRNFGFDKEKGARFAAIISIIGFADVPIVALSIILWQTLHPSALIFEGGLTHRMTITLMVRILAFTLFYLVLTIANYRLHKMEDVVAELESSSYVDDEEERS